MEDILLANLEDTIRLVVKGYVEKEVEQVIEQSKDALEARLKEAVAKAAVRVSQYLEFETYSNKIVITLKTDKINE